MFNIIKTSTVIAVLILPWCWGEAVNADVTVLPADCEVCAGEDIVVQNSTAGPVLVTICLGGGDNFLGLVPPGGTGSWPAPDDPSLIGTTFTVKVYRGNQLVTAKDILIVVCPLPCFDINGDGCINLLDVGGLLGVTLPDFRSMGRLWIRRF